jgi:putative SOS response-associated peptidase YedK
LVRLLEDVLPAAGAVRGDHDEPDDAGVASYTIITTAPNESVGAIHDRMVVILRREDEDEWLDAETTEPGPVLALLWVYPTEEMGPTRSRGW